LNIGNASSDIKEKTFKLFAGRQWDQCVDTLEKNISTLQSDPQALSCLGICYLRLGNYDRAINAFERLQTPIPPAATLNWAAALACQNKLTEALDVLSRVNASLKKKTYEEVMDTVACILLTDIISVINGTQQIGSLKLTRRCRLLKSVSVGVLLFLHILKAIGKFFAKLKFPDGRLIEKIGENTHQLCWAYGMLTKASFMQEHVPLESLNGYKLSHEVYRTIFLRYLEYWMASEVDLTNFLIGSVKPGDAHALYCLVREKQPAVILEVGTFIGFSASIMDTHEKC